MSADNGIFIFDHPHGYGVVHETLSNMPSGISRAVKRQEGCDGSPVFVFTTHALAYSAALAWRNIMLREGCILEYGICDYGNEARKFRPGHLAQEDIRKMRAYLANAYS